VIPHPFGISLFEHTVYFTDWTKMAVMKANKFSDTNPQVVYTTSQTPHGVQVVHQLRQPSGKHVTWYNHSADLPHFCMFCQWLSVCVVFTVANPCGVDGDGCEQICILSHRSDNQGLGYRCRCRMGYDLHADGKRCVGKVNTQTLFRFFPY
jgi:low density lipoprotein-related protein 2